MKNNSLRWEILDKKGIKSTRSTKGIKGIENIISTLLGNRGLKTEKQKEEYFKPIYPEKIGIKELGIRKEELGEAISRIKKAVESDETIVVYGDYDADGICATAILWECLYSLTKNVHPYIPDRFSEGYGLNAESIHELKIKNEKLKIIITVDNGIVANEAIDVANKLGIDVIVTDHHQKGKKLPKAYCILHTAEIGGAGLAWILAREIRKKIITNHQSLITNLELAAIGTIADQLPLIGHNRSFAKYGLEALNNTKRLGLLALFEEAGIVNGQTRLRSVSARQVGTYEVNYIIAPRINAMGRMEHAIDSLRLLCTTNSQRARELAQYLGKTNKERQKVVDEVFLHAREFAETKDWKGAIVLARESYHEGVIGLAAAKLVEEFYRPAIVISKSQMYSKASARSITGFNIIENIRKLDTLIMGGGGHPMAAGFNIETDKIEAFSKKFEEITSPLLTNELLIKRLKIDMEIEFEIILPELYDEISKFEPTGVGNPAPVFVTKGVNVVNARAVGAEGKHLKLTLEKSDEIFSAIAFGKGEIFPQLSPNQRIDIAYNLSEDTWNGNKSLQLKIRDIKLIKLAP